MEIVPLTEEDLDAVMAIEQVSFRAPWERGVFAEEIEREHAYVDLLKDRGRVLGFINYWLVRDEVHLLNVAIAPDARRQGHGARLLEHLITFALRQKARLVTLEVRRSNDAARRMYRKYAFRAIGIRPAYYENKEDAIVMLLDLKELLAPSEESE